MSNILSYLLGSLFSKDCSTHDRNQKEQRIPTHATKKNHSILTLPVANLGAIGSESSKFEPSLVVIQGPEGRILSIQSYLIHVERNSQAEIFAYLEVPNKDLANFRTSEQHSSLYFLWPADNRQSHSKKDNIHEIRF